MTNDAVLVTGGFDPLHSGHIDYFTAAKMLGDKLIVGVNSDEWLARKKGHSFMPMFLFFIGSNIVTLLSTNCIKSLSEEIVSELIFLLLANLL